MSKLGKIFVAGHKGMVGSAVVRKLTSVGEDNLLLYNRHELDLENQSDVDKFYENKKPDTAIIAAAKVGGIYANDTYPAEFIQKNLAIALNTIHSAYKHGVKRLLFLGSSCIYPKGIDQPIKEEYLLQNKLEPTNEAYAIAKICGVKLCEFYRKQYGVMFHSAMPTNLYGPGDYYHPENSHVIPGMITKMHSAKINNSPSVALWGSGKPKREFLHVDDLADAIFHLLNTENPPDLINMGYGEDVSIKCLADNIKEVVGYKGEIIYDKTKPDGIMRKLMDNTLLSKTGWKPKIKLKEGLLDAYMDYLKSIENNTLRN